MILYLTTFSNVNHVEITTRYPTILSRGNRCEECGGNLEDLEGVEYEPYAKPRKEVYQEVIHRDMLRSVTCALPGRGRRCDAWPMVTHVDLLRVVFRSVHNSGLRHLTSLSNRLLVLREDFVAWLPFSG